MMYKTKKIYYPAGLISLVLLPLFCIWHLNREKAFLKQGAVDVTVFDKNDTIQLSRSQINKLPTMRKYTHIRFSGNAKNDSLKLAFAEMTLHELAKSKDTIYGVHIDFRSDTKYWNFAETVELSYIPGVRAAINQEEAWIFVDSQPKKNERQFFFTCVVLMGKPIDTINKEILLALANYKNLFTSRMVWATGLYLVMCAFAIVRLKRL